MVEHSMSFKGNEIQVKQHLCDPELIISYNETLLDEEEAVLVRSLTAMKAPETEGFKVLVLRENHRFMNLFGEPVAQKVPPHRTCHH